MHMANAIVKHRILILVLCILLLIPAAIGMQNTRINYDMLDYLPEDMDTVVGQNALMDDFGKGPSPSLSWRICPGGMWRR